MVLTQIRQLVKIQVTAQPNNRHDKNLPVIESFTARVIASCPVDIIGHKLTQPISQIRVSEDVF